MTFEEPTEKERHFYLQIDEKITKEGLDKLSEQVEKEADKYKEQILQKIKLKKQVLGLE